METKRHFYWIDLLRFLSALLVVLAHYRGSFFVEYGLLPEHQKNIFTQLFFLLTRFGEEPVLVFFVLSGFLVGGRAMQRILTNQVDTKSYFIDRFVRILLPLLASSVFVIFIDLVTNTPIPFEDIIGSIFSMQGIMTSSSHNDPLWSLSYEVWFYIFMGCIMIISRKRGKMSLIAFFVLAICIYVFMQLKTMYLLILLLGTFSFLLPREQVNFRQIKILFLSLLLVLSFFLLQLTSASKSVSISHLSFVNREMASVILAFTTAILVNYLIVSPPKTKAGIKIEAISTKLADFSYTLYLTHFPLIGLLSYLGFPKSAHMGIKPIVYYVISILISLFVAYLIYLISERQTSKVKQLIKERVFR